jgi:hypothetical protein
MAAGHDENVWSVKPGSSGSFLVNATVTASGDNTGISCRIDTFSSSGAPRAGVTSEPAVATLTAGAATVALVGVERHYVPDSTIAVNCRNTGAGPDVELHVRNATITATAISVATQASP